MKRLAYIMHALCALLHASLAAGAMEIEGWACADADGNPILVSREDVYLIDKEWTEYRVELGSPVRVEAEPEGRLLATLMIKDTQIKEMALTCESAEMTLSGMLRYNGPKLPRVLLNIPVGVDKAICLQFEGPLPKWLENMAKAKESLTIKATVRTYIYTVSPSPKEAAESSDELASDALSEGNDKMTLRGVYNDAPLQMRMEFQAFRVRIKLISAIGHEQDEASDVQEPECREYDFDWILSQ